MAPPSCSSSFSYDVFLSFRGEDTRYGFIGHLYKALDVKGIHTFIDDEELQSGEEITPALVNAIQVSRIAIIVLSKDYASSSFCLDELATIIDCKSKGLLVIPVFYKVDPSDVRYHKGSYREALAKHEERFKHNMDKLSKWKKALRQVADISGYHYEQGYVYEYKFIESIVDRVFDEINHFARLSVPDHPVGLEPQKAEVMKLLDVGSNDGVNMVGIYGMGGVGKSSLARIVYNDLIAKKFDGLCYLENVREKSNKHGLEHLQSLFLQKILRDKNINITSVDEGASMIPERLRLKKVLLLLDDVNYFDQLKAILGRHDWLGPGSRVIITTRDKHLLEFHEVKQTYEVKEMNKNDALQMLTWNAFKKGKADPIYEKVLNRVVTYVSGLPLALEVIGCNLFEKSIEEWESAIDQYEKIPNSKIQDVLKVSFDALQVEEKSVFLDLACCLKGLKGVEDILHAHYGHSMKYHVGVLVKKSLIKPDFRNDSFTLHDLIEDMGKEIVRQESPEEPEKRSRLWLPEDIIQVLEGNTGTRKIKILYLDFPKSSKEETIKWDGNAFKQTKNLKILIVKSGKFSEGPKFLPNSLRVLEWREYPSHHLPYDFQRENLVICKLPHTCFTLFELKMFVNLGVLNFDKCKFLTQIPDVSDLLNLKELSFQKCVNLITVHNSVGFLDKLEILNAYGCCKLKSFPPIKLTSLKDLELSSCSSLLSFPEILGKMEKIRELYLDDIAIKELPFSFQYLVGLENLYLDCEVVQLPSSILMMPNLRLIDACNCDEVKWIKQEKDEENAGSIVSSNVSCLYVPSCNLYDDFFLIGFPQFAHLEHLDLSGNNFTFLPECIKEFRSLMNLNVNNCKHLQEIRGVPPNIQFFKARNCRSLTSSSSSMLLHQESLSVRLYGYYLPGTWLPEWFDHKSRESSPSFWFRNRFPVNILCLIVAPMEFVNDKVTYKQDCPAPTLIINGKVYIPHGHKYNKMLRIEMDHTYIFELEWSLMYHRFELRSKNEWNHVKVTYTGMPVTPIIKASGVHVFKKESYYNEDVQFTDPYNEKN